MKKLLCSITVTLLILNSVPANSAVMPLARALNSGHVCERVDGFIEARPGHEADSAELVESVNADRATVYADIAHKEGLDPSVVAAEHTKEIRSQNPGWVCR